MRAGITETHFPFLARLTAAGRRELAALAPTRVKPVQHLLRRGDAAGGAYLVTGGSLRVFYVTADGREATLYRVESGGACVLSLTATFSDPAGDALPDPGVVASPDLVKGTVDEAGGNITLTIQFAPGTFDRSTSRVSVELDADQNPSTGLRTANGLGVDYAVDIWAAASQANVLKSVPTAACTAADPCYTQTGVAPTTLLADGMAVTLPLSMLGNADGHLSFRAFGYASKTGGALPSFTTDIMPDLALAPGHVP